MQCLEVSGVVSFAALLFATKSAQQGISLFVHSIVVLPTALSGEHLSTSWTSKCSFRGQYRLL